MPNENSRFICSNSSLIPGSGLYGAIFGKWTNLCKWRKKDNINAGNPEVPIMAHKVRNPNRLEANHLAIYKRHKGINLGLPRTNPASNKVSEILVYLEGAVGPLDPVTFLSKQ